MKNDTLKLLQEMRSRIRWDTRFEPDFKKRVDKAIFDLSTFADIIEDAGFQYDATVFPPTSFRRAFVHRYNHIERIIFDTANLTATYQELDGVYLDVWRDSTRFTPFVAETIEKALTKLGWLLPL